MRNKVIAVSSVFLLAVYFIGVYDVNFRGADEPVYLAYTASALQDGDLNIIDQVHAGPERFPISVTGNSPDFHNHGGTLLWAPFYAYARAAYAVADVSGFSSLSVYGRDKIIRCAMSLGTLLFGILALLLSYLLCRRLSAPGGALFSVSALFLGTPFFYYMLFDTHNANILASLFSVISLWLLFSLALGGRPRWFIYGIFFSLAVSVKTELWFQLVAVSMVASGLLYARKMHPRHILYFFLGLLPVTGLRAVNAWLKYGAVHMEEVIYWASGVRYSPSYNFNGLFDSYRGIFYTSPIFYLCFIGLILIIYKILVAAGKRKEISGEDIFLLACGAYAATKVFFIGRIFSPGGDSLSARLLLAEFPVFSLLLAFLLGKQGRTGRLILFVVTLFLVFWNLLVVSEFILHLDWAYIVGTPGVLSRSMDISRILGLFLSFKEIPLKLKLLPGLFIALLVITFYFLRNKAAVPAGHMPRIIFPRFLLYLLLAYSALTLMNLCSNQKNVRRLTREGFFQNAQKVESAAFKMNALEEEEHLWAVFEMMRFYALKGDKARLLEVKCFRERVFGRKECIYARFPRPQKAYAMSGYPCMEISRYRSAIELYRGLIFSSPGDTDFLISLGDIYAFTGGISQAAELFLMAFESDPRSLNACSRLAEAYLQAGDPERAVRYYREYLKLAPGAVEAYIILGGVSAAKKEYREAITYFETAVHINPLHTESQMSLANIYNSQGDYDKAERYLLEAIALRPAAEAYMVLSSIYAESGRCVQAGQAYHKARQIDPEFRDDQAKHLLANACSGKQGGD